MIRSKITEAANTMDVTLWLERAEKVIALDLNKRKQRISVLIDAYYYEGKQLLPRQVSMFADDLEEFDPEALQEACVVYRKRLVPEGCYPRPPRPSDLIAILQPKVDAKDEAALIANNIHAAIGRFGAPNMAAAREHLGAAAWAVVRMRGTWEDLCRSCTVENQGTTVAQLRELARAVLQANNGRIPTHHTALPEHSMAELSEPVQLEIEAEPERHSAQGLEKLRAIVAQIGGA